jgi:hypothetical protein
MARYIKAQGTWTVCSHCGKLTCQGDGYLHMCGAEGYPVLCDDCQCDARINKPSKK